MPGSAKARPPAAPARGSAGPLRVTASGPGGRQAIGYAAELPQVGLADRALVP